MKTISFALIFILCLQGVKSQNLSATDIIKKADARMRGNSSIAELKMTIVRPTWQRELEMKSWTKGDDLALILITAPARDKGVAYLKRDKELWNWQPSIDRVIKLPPSMMLQSWMGSDFTNDDLVKESSAVHDYFHALGKDTVISGYACYAVVLTPKPEAAVVWGKIHTWITKDDFIQIRSEFYDEDGFLINTMVASEIKNMDGRMLPSHLEMIPSDKEGHKTMLDYRALKFDVELSDDFFTIQNMKRLK